MKHLAAALGLVGLLGCDSTPIPRIEKNIASTPRLTYQQPAQPRDETLLRTTPAGLYTVTFARQVAPLDVQEEAFAAQGLSMVSPAQLGFLRATQPKGVTTFNNYSRTNADVFYDDRDNSRVVIVPGGAISRQVGVTNLFASHREGREYVIPESQRDFMYAMVDTLLRNGTAFVVQHGDKKVLTSDFGRNDLTARLFSDKALGIEAQDYGDWLQAQGRSEQVMYFYSKDYATSLNGPYVKRLRVFGPVGGFDVDGYLRILDDNYGAFWVRFEKTAEGGAKK